MIPLWVSYGGSNRKMGKDLKVLTAKFGADFKSYGSRYGVHASNCIGVIPDTADNRMWVKAQVGIGINREMAKIQKERGN